MLAQDKKSTVKIDIKGNKLNICFNGVVTKKELEQIYTDVRFGVGDLQPEFKVISDFSECRLMYLNGLPTFRKIFKYIISNISSDIIRVLPKKRLISKQIINATLYRKGYKPIYTESLEEAEAKIASIAKRDGLRFDLLEQPVDITYNEQKYSGHILNISTSGSAVTSKSVAPEKGDQVQLRFSLTTLSSSDVFEFSGTVVRKESYSFAVNFIDLDNHKKSLLWKCLVDLSEGEVR
jgi:hypothetical protein